MPKISSHRKQYFLTLVRGPFADWFKLFTCAESTVTWIQIRAGLSNRKKMKAEPIQLIPRKFTQNLELFKKYCRREP